MEKKDNFTNGILFSPKESDKHKVVCCILRETVNKPYSHLRTILKCKKFKWWG